MKIALLTLFIVITMVKAGIHPAMHLEPPSKDHASAVPSTVIVKSDYYSGKYPSPVAELHAYAGDVPGAQPGPPTKGAGVDYPAPVNNIFTVPAARFPPGFVGPSNLAAPYN